MVKTDDFSKEMHQKVGDKEIITIKGSDKLSKALSLFKDHKISKLVVVNDQGAIDGIVSQYDITDVVAAPKERAGSGMRTGNKDVQLDKPIRNFAKKHVSTLGEHATFAEVAKQILEQKIGSIVIANAKRMPVGIVTTKDILSFMVPKEIQKGIEVSIKELNESDEKIVLNTVEALNKKLVQRGISKGHLVARGKHKGGIFEVTFSCIDEHGYISVHQEGQHLHDIMMELADKVTSRLDY
jgi:CBS domain-containing protein